MCGAGAAGPTQRQTDYTTCHQMGKRMGHGDQDSAPGSWYLRSVLLVLRFEARGAVRLVLFFFYSLSLSLADAAKKCGLRGAGGGSRMQLTQAAAHTHTGGNVDQAMQHAKGGCPNQYDTTTLCTCLLNQFNVSVLTSVEPVPAPAAAGQPAQTPAAPSARTLPATAHSAARWGVAR